MTEGWPALAFNARPRIEALPLGGRHACWIIDDALVDAQACVDFAAAQRSRFDSSAHNAYPGPELRLPDALASSLDGYFAMHLRARLGARRVQRMYARLSMTTRAPAALEPRQRLCHVDRLEVQPGQVLGASVLYLFDDAGLGGTSFYRPVRPLPEIAALLRDAATLDTAAFDARYALPPGYMVDSNAWFERVATVPARYNRLVVYDGGLFHSGDIRHPERLSDDRAAAGSRSTASSSAAERSSHERDAARALQAELAHRPQWPHGGELRAADQPERRRHAALDAVRLDHARAFRNVTRGSAVRMNRLMSFARVSYPSVWAAAPSAACSSRSIVAITASSVSDARQNLMMSS